MQDVTAVWSILQTLATRDQIFKCWTSLPIHAPLAIPNYHTRLSSSPPLTLTSSTMARLTTPQKRAREPRIVKAIDEWHRYGSERFMSQDACAKAHGITSSTFSRRLRRITVNYTESRERTRRLRESMPAAARLNYGYVLAEDSLQLRVEMRTTTTTRMYVLTKYTGMCVRLCDALCSCCDQ
jgi:hypothetical protein